MSDHSEESSLDATDEQLVSRLADGDHRALHALFERHERLMYRVALARVRCPWGAEDVVASALLQLWRKRADVRVVDGSAVPWLLSVVGFVGRNHVRGLRRHTRLLAKIPYDGVAPDHAEAVGDRVDATAAVRRILDAAIEPGSPDTEVLLSCLLKEVSIREAAAMLAVPEGTVKSRVHRLRSRLRRRLDEGRRDPAG